MEGGFEDDDEQPYNSDNEAVNEDFDEDSYFNSEEERKRQKAEFCEDEEESDSVSEKEEMSLTMMDRKRKLLEKEINSLKRRQLELKQMISRKREEGV